MPTPLGRPIRVGVFEHDPDAFNCFRQMPRKRCVQPGAEIEIISAVMQILQWDWEIVDTNQEFGIINDFGNKKPDGNFSGIMGLLASDSIDMGGLSMRITPDRMKVAHFTFPIRYFQQVYIINKPPEADFKHFVFTSVTPTLWVYLLLVFCLVSMLKFVIGFLIDQRPIPTTNLLTGSMLESFGLMVKQRVAIPTSWSMKLLEGFLITSMMFVGQYYQTSMNSKLTAPPKSKVPFYHQDELLNLLDDLSFSALFENGQKHPTYYIDVKMEGSTPRNQERIDAFWDKNTLVTHDTTEEIAEELRRGGVFFSTYDVELLPYPVSSWDKEERMTVIRDTTGLLSYVAFGFSISNKKLCRLFNEALVKVLPGVPQMTLGPGYARKKGPEDISIQVQRTTLTLKCHLEQLFLIFGILMLINIASFGVEQLIFRSQAQVHAVAQNRTIRAMSNSTQEKEVEE